METETETTVMATPQYGRAKGKKLHKVYVVYEENEEGQKLKERQELRVSGYPPVDLEIDDEIAFIPIPPGKLALTFKNGSNFAKEGLGPYEIRSNGDGKAIRRVKRLMTRVELKKLQKAEYARPRNDGVHVEKNAFPFMCELTSMKYGGPNGKPKTYKAGFPSRPDGDNG
jgi:hypothetical protein